MKLTICSDKQFKTKQGIHSFISDIHYLKDAIENAFKEGFRDVYIHYTPSYPSRYNIDYDVLNHLIQLSNDPEFTVHFSQPILSKDTE